MTDRLEPAARRPSIAATSLCCLVVSIGTAHAQSAEAEVLFNDGTSLMDQGKLAEACDAFEASNRIEPRAGTLIRLGACREKNHQLASAWSAYKDALTRAKDPSKKQIAKSKAAELEAKLSVLTVSVAGDSRVDGLELARNGQLIDHGLWNRAIPVNGGEYVISARAPGREDWQMTVKVAIASAKITVEIPRLAEHAKAAPPPKPERINPVPKPLPASSPPRASSPPADEDDEAMPAITFWTTQRKVAVVIGGVAAIGVVTGIALGSQAKSKQNAALVLCPDPQTPCADSEQANALIQTGRTRAIAADSSFAIAGAAAIAAGVLWFMGAPVDRSSHQVAVVPSIVPGATLLAVTGRF